MEKQTYPRLIECTDRASYWEMEPGRFQAFPPIMRDAPKDNGAGYADLGALKRLKGD